MKNPILVPEIRDLLKNGNVEVLKSFIDDHHEKEIAEYISLLTPEEIWSVLDLAEEHNRADIFSYFDMDVQVNLITGTFRKKAAALIDDMSHDDRADLFKNLDNDVADKILLLLPPKDRRDVLNLTSYQEGTCGAIMTTDYATLFDDDDVDEAIAKIRQMAPAKETIYYIYVTNRAGQLIGFVSLRDLIIAKAKEQVKDIMKSDVIYINSNDDQEKSANLIKEYDLLALPVVDVNGLLCGIITHDDAIDIIVEEQTEDLEKLMAISGGVEKNVYLETPTLTHFKKRVLWVVILGIMGLLTGLVIQGFQTTLEKLIVLTFYMPLLTAAGGNTGSQSATVVLRSLTLNELNPADILKVMFKEFKISFLLCICLGLITYLRVYFLSGGVDIPPEYSLSRIALVVSLALAIQVVGSTVFGATIPIIATKLKIDPAVFSSPVLTTIVDMGGIFIYFGIAKLILGI